MLFAFHEKIMGEGPGAFQDDGLVRVVEDDIPVAGDDKGEPHEDGGGAAHAADAREVRGRGVQHVHEHPHGGEQAGDAEGDVGHQDHFVHKIRIGGGWIPDAPTEVILSEGAAGGQSDFCPDKARPPRRRVNREMAPTRIETLLQNRFIWLPMSHLGGGGRRPLRAGSRLY